MVTFLLTGTILVLIIFYKQYRTIVQHLAMYLTIFIMLYLALTSASIQLQPQFFHPGDTACKWTGYFQTVLYISSLITTFELSAYLLYVMQFQVRGKPIPALKRWRKVLLELVGVFVAVVIPAVPLGIYLNNFGISGAICAVKVFKIDNSTNCSLDDDAYALRTVVLSIYNTLHGINVISYALLIVIFCLLACKYQQTRSHHKHTIARTIILVSYLVLSSSIHLASALYFYYFSLDDSKVNKPSLILSCILTPATEFLRPLAFMFYLNSVKRFKWQVAKNTAGEWKASWKSCFFRFKRWLRRKWGFSININDMSYETDEYFTPDLTTTSQYGTTLRSTGVD